MDTEIDSSAIIQTPARTATIVIDNLLRNAFSTAARGPLLFVSKIINWKSVMRPTPIVYQLIP